MAKQSFVGLPNSRLRSTVTAHPSTSDLLQLKLDEMRERPLEEDGSLARTLGHPLKGNSSSQTDTVLAGTSVRESKRTLIRPKKAPRFIGDRNS